MQSFVATILVLAAATNAFVIPQGSIAQRDDNCTPGLYNCIDGQHFQQCTAGKVWSATLICSAGTACTTGISENPFIRAGESAPPAASPPADSPSPAAPSKTDSPPPPPVVASSSSSSAAAQVTDSPPPPPPPAASPTTKPAGGFTPAPSAEGDSTSTITTSVTSSTTTLATTTATAVVTDSPPPPPPPAASVTTTATSTTTDSPPPPPADSPAPSPTVSDSPPPPPQSTTNPNAGEGGTFDEACFEFTSQNPDWYYAMQNPWGSATGKFGDLKDGKLCVPTNNDAGGAMYIGSVPNPGPGNTKLECFFPTSGTANCDNSLVDGYSLSVKCTAGDAVIGSDDNLWNLGTCPGKVKDGVCPNAHDEAYGPEEKGVNKFFQPNGRTGNRNCVWWACDQDYFFSASDARKVTCNVSGSVPADS